MASVKLIEPTPSAYGYPLLIKHLLKTPLAHATHKEIVYHNLRYNLIPRLRNGSESSQTHWRPWGWDPETPWA